MRKNMFLIFMIVISFILSILGFAEGQITPIIISIFGTIIAVCLQKIIELLKEIRGKK